MSAASVATSPCRALRRITPGTGAIGEGVDVGAEAEPPQEQRCRSGVGGVRQVTENLGSVTYLGWWRRAGGVSVVRQDRIACVPARDAQKSEETMTYQAEIS